MQVPMSPDAAPTSRTENLPDDGIVSANSLRSVECPPQRRLIRIRSRRLARASSGGRPSRSSGRINRLPRQCIRAPEYPSTLLQLLKWAESSLKETITVADSDSSENSGAKIPILFGAVVALVAASL